MPEKDHKEEIARIDTRCAELREEIPKLDVQIRKLEFQNKRDIAETEKRRKEWDEMITTKIDYIAKLAGITYEELDMMDDKFGRAGDELSRPREHSTLS